MGVYSRQDLELLKPQHDALIGIDSDGCVFDSMSVKQCVHFHPLIIRFWQLESIESALRETAEFVNLRSVWRGRNRFAALLKTFELLETRADVLQSGVKLPDLNSLRGFVHSGKSLGNPALEAEVAGSGNTELQRLLEWSKAVNRSIESQPVPIPLFNGVRKSLILMAETADTLVVSQTPEAALVSEWRQHGLEGLVRLIAGQELGSKAEHLRLASEGKYAAGRVLLLGDAPGDLEAAVVAGVSFYPILPGGEAASWERFHDEALKRFLDGTYDALYQAALVQAFLNLLPSTPPWS